MRRPFVSLSAVAVGLFGWLTTGLAEEFNPFAEQVSLQEAVAPLSPQPVPVEAMEQPGAAPHGETHDPTSGMHDGTLEMQEAHGDPHTLGQDPHSVHHAQPHHGYEYGHEHGHEHAHEHEEPIGNIRVTPLYREIESDIWNRVFDNMYSVNVGTTFWQHERHHDNYSTQVGLVTEFQYSRLDAKSDTNINSVTSIPFARRENLRVKDADIYGGNIGLSFVVNTYLPNSATKLELGVSPLLTIGSLNADLEPNRPTAGQDTIVLDRGASDNGTIVGGDFRLWTGIKTESGYRAGITGFYGVAETDAIFDSSETFNTYGGGVYLEMPTRFVPHEFPAPKGTFQWFEETFGLY